MPSGKKFFIGRSELTDLRPRLADDAEATSDSRVYAFPVVTNMRASGARQATDDEARESMPSHRALGRFMLATKFDLISRASTRATFVDLALTNFPVAILSWIMTQFMAGCAAYAEAMYPSAGYVGGHDALRRCGQPEDERTESDQVGLPPQAPALQESSGFAIDAKSRQKLTETGPEIINASGENGNIVWLGVTQKIPSRRFATTALLVTTWLSKMRRSVPNPPAVDLKTLDRRLQRGAAMSRCGAE